jgi:hypothetical protein
VDRFALRTTSSGREVVLDRVREPAAAGRRPCCGNVGRALQVGWRGENPPCNPGVMAQCDQYAAMLSSLPRRPMRSTVTSRLGDRQVLDLPEQQVPEEPARVAAVLHWLQVHRLQLLILDNIDAPQRVRRRGAAREAHGGQVLLTGRLSAGAVSGRSNSMRSRPGCR